MLKEEQERVYDWLNNDLRLPVFAEAYKGAVIIKENKSAGYVSFVAHAGRDLMNILAATVAGVKAKQVQYKNHIDKLQVDWQEEWGFSDSLSPEITENGHLIPVEVCQRVSTLIEEHKSGSMRSSEANGLFFSTFLDYSDIDKIPDNFLFEWKKAKIWFVGHAHLRKNSFPGETDDNLEKHFNCLDGYLYIAASSQYDRLKELNEILDATNR
ncbi:hypothetical protein [Alteromonas stellipolaris]|uniref:hypothetical protein n=1 Tax=Alteromonas stellipolaris TaxID=233316 RepID=UPI0027348EA7|nr:hypothetical protein [Alteromonas stellipolaris]MDP2535601.1 hypothetical protein [Alteromonas stellipolaris]